MRRALLIAGILMSFQAFASPQTIQSSCFKGFTDLSSFSKLTPWQTGEEDYLSPVIDAGQDWNELIASWNVQAGDGAEVSVSARAFLPDHETKFYVMGIWSPDAKSFKRTSVSGQKDADGDVDTDTLKLLQKAREVQVLIATKPASDGTRPNIQFLGLCFADTQGPKQDPTGAAFLSPMRGVSKIAAIAPLEVPERCQMDYPHGGAYCSATSVSMVLSYWSQKLNRPDINLDVPSVVSGVYDFAFDGTGNWPFNTAYAGSFPGMRAYITRFSSTDEIRDWIAAGFPVITSGSLPVLEGKPRPKGDPGHLVVLVGFTDNGDPIFNDPAHSDVRRTYKRADFEKSWDTSNHTVYLIYPETMTPPEDKLGQWYR